MGPIADLWLPILVTAVFVFIASSVIWMATPIHKGDYTVPPDEDGIVRVLRERSFKPGQYYIPWCSGANMKDPAFLERMKTGPWAMMYVMSGPPSFGKSLGLWFVSQIFIASLVAYVAGTALPTAAENEVTYLRAFQIAGGTALCAHAACWMENSIWRGLPWRISFVKLIDGTIYTCITAGVFGWLWPH